MGNVSLKVLEKSLNFLFKNGYEPCSYDYYFYRILNNENFKMEVEQTNFVTHLIISTTMLLII